MKKRKKYVPKLNLQDPISRVLSRFVPVREEPEQLLSLNSKNYSALSATALGEGNRAHCDTLIAAVNMSDGLRITAGHGQDYADEIRASQNAVLALSIRAKRTDYFSFEGIELTAVETGIDILTEQLNITTLGELESALAYVKKVQRSASVRRVA
jgi:hypothetical protein